jgi:exopolysaccharide biosynthesis polyprenyl glycosylphosphotransferase
MVPYAVPTTTEVVPRPRSPLGGGTYAPPGVPPSGGRRHAEPRPALQRWMRRYVVAAVAADLVAAALAGVAAQLVRFGTEVGPTTLVALILAPLGWALLVMLCGGYDASRLGTGNEEFRSVLRALVVGLALVAFVAYAADLSVSRALVVIAVPGAGLLTALGRAGLRGAVHVARRRGRCLRAVVAVGREGAVLELVRQLRRDRSCGMEVVAACVTDPAGADLLRAEEVPVVGDLRQAALAVRRLGVDAVAVTSSSETAASYLRRLSWDLEGSGVELLVAPGLMEVAGPRMHMRPFIGLPLVHVEEPEFRGPKRLVKEVLDRLGAAALVLLVLPVLLAIAVAVRVDTPGPVFFRQQRIGKTGRPFTMLKFRSMVVDAEARRADLAERNQNADGLLFKVADDPRVTRVGRLLRRFSLDELPQLLNVLSGSMSLVGPRPPLPSEVARYDDDVRRRLLVKPGLTGLWQISGRSDLTWEEAVRLDLRYVENWSLALDLSILWKTFSAVLHADGAY